MVGSVNKAFLLGACGRDPEIRTMQSGDKIANMSIATSERWKDAQSGERRERTEWTRVTVFNPHLVSVIEKYVKKGSTIFVEGQLRTRKWTDKNGEDRFSTEVVLPNYGGQLVLVSSPKREGGDGGYQPREPSGTDQKGNPQYGGSTGADLDDEIPFAPEWR